MIVVVGCGKDKQDIECGHKTTRDWPRNRPSTPVGSKLRCETCSESATERACA